MKLGAQVSRDGFERDAAGQHDALTSPEITSWRFHDASTDPDGAQIPDKRKALKVIFFQGLVCGCGERI